MKITFKILLISLLFVMYQSSTLLSSNLGSHPDFIKGMEVFSNTRFIYENANGKKIRLRYLGEGYARIHHNELSIYNDTTNARIFSLFNINMRDSLTKYEDSLLFAENASIKTRDSIISNQKCKMTLRDSIRYQRIFNPRIKDTIMEINKKKYQFEKFNYFEDLSDKKKPGCKFNFLIEKNLSFIIISYRHLNYDKECEKSDLLTRLDIGIYRLIESNKSDKN